MHICVVASHGEDNLFQPNPAAHRLILDSFGLDHLFGNLVSWRIGENSPVYSLIRCDNECDKNVKFRGILPNVGEAATVPLPVFDCVSP